MNIEEQMAVAKDNKVTSLEAKQVEKAKAKLQKEQLEANKKFLKEGKCFYNLFEGKEKDLEDLRTYMANWCLNRTIMGENAGISKDFIAGIRMMLDVMEQYPKEYKKVMTEMGGTV